MTENVGDLFEWGTSHDESLRESVAKCMRTVKMGLQAAACCRITNGISHNEYGGRHTEGRTMAHEECSAARCGSSMTEIVDDCPTTGPWQRQYIDAVALATDAHYTLSPVEVI
jgi:hypothetical protein